MVQRLLKPLQSRSFFLFGARSTGKSTLLQALPFFDERAYIDLLDDDVLEAFSKDPQRLTLLANDHKWIFIDEIQKSTKLLNAVHKLIATKRTKFALTGSSARKLKRGGANLLGGRANVYQLFPFTVFELPPQTPLSQLLQFGSLPELVSLNSLSERREYLKSYYQTFLKEEIVADIPLVAA